MEADAQAQSPPPPPPSNVSPIRPGLIIPALIRPRSAFREIVAAKPSPVLTPLLLISILLIALSIISGSIRIQDARENFELPQEFENLPEERQAEIRESAQATQGPLFFIVFPVIGAVTGFWIGWLILGGLLHLSLTLFGSSTSTGETLNIVAWSLLPFGVRHLVQIIYMLATGNVVQQQGLGGFGPLDAGPVGAAATACLALFDVYLLWQIALLIVGVNARGESKGKAGSRVAVIVSILIVMGLRTVVTFGLAQIGTSIAGGG